MSRRVEKQRGRKEGRIIIDYFKNNICSFFPDQSFEQQPQNLEQSQASFNEDAMSNQAAPVQQNYNYYTRSNIPAAPQTQQVIRSLKHVIIAFVAYH